MEVDNVIDVDTNHNDPQFCTTLACDIYRHLRIAEVKFLFCISFAFLSAGLFHLIFYTYSDDNFTILVNEMLSLPNLMINRFSLSRL